MYNVHIYTHPNILHEISRDFHAILPRENAYTNLSTFSALLP